MHPLRLYLLASILFFFAVNYAIKSAHFDPINLSPENRAEIRDELQRENLAPEVRAKIEAALGGVEVPPNNRARLEEELKREDLSADARREIQERLQHGDPVPSARTKIEDAMKDLPPEVRARIQDALKGASPRRHRNPSSRGKRRQSRKRTIGHASSLVQIRTHQRHSKNGSKRVQRKRWESMEQRWGCLSRRCLAICLT